MIEHSPPRFAAIASSRMNCGTCVVFPHPVAPETTHERHFETTEVTAARNANAGRSARFFFIAVQAGSDALRRSSRSRRSDTARIDAREDARRSASSASVFWSSAAAVEAAAPKAKLAAAARATSSSGAADASSATPSRSSTSRKPSRSTCFESQDVFALALEPPAAVFSTAPVLGPAAAAG